MADLTDIAQNEGYLGTPEPSPPASDDLSSNDFPSNISDLDSDDSSDDFDAEAEWEENIAQIRMLFELVIFPFAGKFLGRKFSFWAWGRYMDRHIKAIAVQG